MLSVPNPREDMPYTVNSLEKYTNINKQIIVAMADQKLIDPYDFTPDGKPRYLLGEVRAARKLYQRGTASKSAGVTRHKDGTVVCLTVYCNECMQHFMPHEVNTRRLCIGCAAKHHQQRARTLAEAETAKGESYVRS